MVHQFHQIKQLIERRGLDCIFLRQGENEFHEPSGDMEILTCKGLFHETNGYLRVSMTESGKIYTQKEPKVLILYSGEVLKGDLVIANGIKFKVTGIDDLGNLHLCLDLSLEVV